VLSKRYCETHSKTITGIQSRFNTADIKNKYINTTNYQKYLPQFLKEVGLPWKDCNNEVKVELRDDYYTNMEGGLRYLAERYAIVLFYGENDYVDSWESGKILLERVFGVNMDDYDVFDWRILDKVYGHFYRSGNITMIHVVDSGHLVVLQQPEFAFQLLNRFVFSTE